MIFYLKKIDHSNFFRPNIIKFWTKFGNKLGCILKQQLHSIFFFFILLLDVNFDKSTIELHFFLISSVFANFQKDQRTIAISSIKCLNFEFL